MHTEILHAVLPEIRDALVGHRVTKVELVGKYGVLVRFADAKRDLWLSSHPELSRTGLVERPPDVGAPRTAPDNLDEPLGSAVLREVEGEPGGRVARFRFERRDAARHAEPVLIAELIPRFANVILTGNDDRILWCRREFTGAGRPRQVAAGETYAAPGGAPERETAAPPPVTVTDGASPNATADAWYRAREEEESSGLLLAELRRTLVKRRKRAAKALVQIDSRLEEAGREAELREHAELLTAHLKLARRGMASVRIPAFDGSGEVEIALDPKLDPRGNAEALFKKARRVARGRDEMIAQRSVQQEEVDRMDAAMARLDPPPAPEALREIVRELAPSLLAAERRGSARGAGGGDSAPERPSSLPDGFNPRRYLLPGGWEVWVGRSAKQNDELTHRWASQRDLWFHARGAQGSHTVLRVGSGKGQPPREIIEAAAAVAAWFSKARNSNLVPVAYTEKRYVRKPRKSPVGTAMMMREKVVMVTPALPDGEKDQGLAAGRP
ncbi:MAG TPA: NFACT RNA binding domain-containing protein [bacterium]|nr:NFACT RNA binding domain-containing protein [bacterium]